MLTVTSTDGVSIAAFQEGDGDPMVLVHGVLSDHARWEPVSTDLAQHFSVYGMDRRGRGESGDTEEYALDREIDDVVSLVESIDGPVHLVGHSFGAVCALEAARTIDDDLASLVLYEPPIAPSSPTGHPYPADVVEAMRSALDDGDSERVIELFRLEISGFSQQELEEARSQPGWDEQVAIAHTLVREIDALETFEFEPDAYRSVSTPVGLLYGSETREEQLEVLDQLEDALPQCARYELDGQGHVAMATGPEVLTSAILECVGSG